MADSNTESTGNSNVGMQADSFETAEQGSQDSTAFFEGLENQVNSGIQEQGTEATQSPQAAPTQVTRSTEDNGSNNVAEQSNNGTDWQKRYTDSSREAVRWRDRYKEVEQFVPVLEAMKNDSGLVDHVREYLVNGGQPAKSIQKELQIPEDFQFDQQEAMTDPESQSAKLMQAHVDKMVQSRVGEMINTEKERASLITKQQERKREELAFMAKNNMSAEDFDKFKNQAKNHVMTLDDVNYLINRDKTANNVAESTRKDMLNQMKNVRNIPTSASGANSQGGAKTEDRNVFDSILGFDESVDNLFG